MSSNRVHKSKRQAEGHNRLNSGRQAEIISGHCCKKHNTVEDLAGRNKSELVYATEEMVIRPGVQVCKGDPVIRTGG